MQFRTHILGIGMFFNFYIIYILIMEITLQIQISYIQSDTYIMF